jgi:hypothetical protein
MHSLYHSLRLHNYHVLLCLLSPALSLGPYLLSFCHFSPQMMGCHQDYCVWYGWYLLHLMSFFIAVINYNGVYWTNSNYYFVPHSTPTKIHVYHVGLSIGYVTSFQVSQWESKDFTSLPKWYIHYILW